MTVPPFYIRRRSHSDAAAVDGAATTIGETTGAIPAPGPDAMTSSPGRASIQGGQISRLGTGCHREMRSRSLSTPDRDLGGDYERLRLPVLRRARRWFPTLSEQDLEDIYQSAWLSVIRTSSEIEGIEPYLYRAVRSEGLMQLRRRDRKSTESLDAAGRSSEELDVSAVPEGLVDRGTSPQERAELSDLARVTEELLAELSSRQQVIVKLRWGWSLSREEIAAALGVSPRSVKRELAALSVRLREQADVVVAGGWCERRRSLVTAYALGLLSSRSAPRARRHLERCPGCRALVQELRARSDELAAVLPAPVLTELPEGRVWISVGESLEAARAQLQEVIGSAKQHAAAAYVRASDPTPLVGARPGAVVATVAGCLAVGGGTYCAVEGLPGPVRSALELGQRGEARQPRAGGGRPRAAQVDPVPTPVETPEPLPVNAAPRPADEPAPAPVSPPSSAPPPEPPPEEFFGATEAPAAPVAQASTADSESSAAPAPTPAQERGEFGGP